LTLHHTQEVLARDKEEQIGRTYLNPALGVHIKLKHVWAGHYGEVLVASLHREMLASKGCDPARNQRLLTVWAHKGTCKRQESSSAEYFLEASFPC